MNMRLWLVRLVLIVCAVTGSVPVAVYAQTGLGSEEEVKKAAAELFDEGQYGQAYKLYSQLLATYPKDPNYNYRFGVCKLFSQADKEEALTFLEKASKDPGAEKDVFFYLGRAYHLNYRFDDAIRAYERFKKEAGPKKAEKLQVDNQIASCRTGKKLLKSITDLTVLEKKELSASNFYSSYDLRDYNGKLLVKPDDFKTALDKKKKEKSVIFLPTEKTEIYFSSYGNDEENGKDIYIVRRLPNGEWSKPQNVGYPINTEYDEDYPFLHPNGKILYFCSKGHNSMGGYDIFKSTLNEETNTWTKPVNLDFAINTPDDDILYITDYEGNTAYFSSSRSSPDGQMTVYRVRVERRPAEICLIKGVYKPSEGDENLKARIIVKNKETDNIEGIFQSNEKTGDYLMNLPNGGKFEVTVEKNGKVTQTASMFIPPQYEIKAIRQELGYDANKKLYLNTLFDNDTAGLSADFLKERAKLNVSTSEPVATRETIDLNAGKDPVTNNGGNANNGGTDPPDNGNPNNGGNTAVVKNTDRSEEVKQAYTNASDADKEWKDLNSQSTQAYAIAAQKNRDAISKNKAADAAQREADAATDPETKKQAQQRADDLRAQANVAENNTVAALNLAQALERDATQKKKEADLANDYAKKFDAAVKKNDKAQLDQLNAQKNQLELFSKTTPENQSTRNGLKEEADKKTAEAKKATDKVNELRDEVNEYNTQIAQQQAEADKEKDPQLKEGIMAQLGDLKEERDAKQRDLAKAEKRNAQLEAEARNANEQLAMIDQAIEQVKNGTGPAEQLAAADKQQLQNDAKNYEREVVESNGTRPLYAGTNTNNGTTNGTNNGGTNGGTDPVATNNGGTNGGTDPVATNNGGTTNDNTPSTVSGIQSKFDEPLAKATASTDPLAAETSKAEVYNDWVQAIDAAIAQQKEAASNEKDRKKKQEINANIAALEKEKKDKQALAQQAEKRADEIKSGIASTNGGTDPVATNNGGNTNDNTPNTVSGIQSKFDEPLAKATASTDPLAAETSKAEVYNDWVQAIDAAIAQQKDAASNEKDRKKKQEINANIAALEQEKKDKQALAQQAEKRADEIKSGIASTNGGTDPVATNNGGTTNDNTPNTVSGIQSKFDEPLAKATSSTDPLAAETSKAEVYNDWVQAIDAAIAQQKEAASNEKDRKKKQEINANIAALEQEKKDKQALAQQAEKRADEIKSGIASTNGGTDPVATNNGGTTNDNTPNTVSGIQSKFDEPLAKASASTDPLAAETSKAEVYNDWVKAIDAAIAQQKEAASNEKDRKKKDEINANITALEQEKKEKQTLAQQAEKRADEIKAGVATTNGGNDPATNGTTATAADYNQRFASDVAAADTITDPYEKAKKRNSLHQDWVVALNNDLAETRNALKTETDKSKKDSLKAEIKTIENKLAEVKREQQASAVALNNAKKEQEKQAAEHPELAINNRFENELKDKSTQGNAETEKVTVLKNWSDALQAEADNKKKERDATRDKNKRIKLEQQITLLEEQATARQEEAQKLEAAIATNNSSTNGGTDPVTNNGGTDPVTNNGGTNPVTNNGGTDPVTNNGGTNPVTNNGGTNPVTNNGGTNTVTNNGGTDPVTNNGGMNPVTNNGGTNPVTNNGGTDPVTNNGGTNPVTNNGSTDPVTNNGGTNPVTNNGGTDPVTNNGANTSNPLNPTTGKPFTNDELAAVKNSTSYKNYSDLQQEANQTAERGTTQAALADDYKKKSQNHIRLSQEWAEKAAAATDPQEKAKAVEQAGNENALALADKNRSDSVRAIADNTLADARSKQVEADQFLNDLDRVTYEQVKAAATTDPAVNAGTTALASNTNTNNSANNGATASNTNGINGGTTNSNNGGTTNTNNGGTTNTSNGANTSTVNTPPVAVNGTNTSSITPRLGQNERYAVGTSPVYNNDNRIPVDPEVPSGIIYKVQIGAFRNPIPQDIFKGITPITGETTPQGITRYTAGQFTTFNTADAAKEEIRSLGFRDAFVVAFKNGKRISVEEARGETGSSTPVAVNSSNGGNNGGTTTTNTNGGNTNNGNTPVTNNGGNNGGNTLTTNNTPPDNTAGVASTQVSQVRGLFYTVQVGVYSRPVSAAQLYNLEDIFSEPLPNGNTRYFSGSYNTFRDATGAKGRIVGRGVRDAFITAYRDGKRITLAEARQLSGEGDDTNTVPATNGGNTTPANNGNTTPATNGGNTTPTTPVISGDPAVIGTGLVYCVQLGAFSQEVPVSMVNKFLQLAPQGVRNFKDQNSGYTIYIAGRSTTYADIVKLKAEVVDKGVTDAFIVAFMNGKKVSIDEAKKLSGE
jgi:hypothetical protein